MQKKHRAVFLDRDGTIIEDVGYIASPQQVQLLPGVDHALEKLKRIGFLLVLVSNQSAVGRGWITQKKADAIHDRVLTLLSMKNIHLDAAYYCIHKPSDHCSCRKPSPGLLLRAANEHCINLRASYMVGDKMSDVYAGKKAGCFTILLRHVTNEYDIKHTSEAAHPDKIVRSWNEATAFFSKQENSFWV